MNVIPKAKYDQNAPATRKKGMPEGLFTKCPACSEIIFNKELEENQMVCSHCGHHGAIRAHKRLTTLLDKGSFEETDAGMTSVDVLEFTGATSYSERLATYQKKTGVHEAVVTGVGQIEGQPVAIGVMDFAFLGGSMGSVVGEKITRLLELALERELPAVLFCASGGARMHEGMLSLMQMPKTSGAAARLAAARRPLICVLTNPTMGGVTASFAVLGDVTLAEPGAMVGFAGARVIKETTQQDLPEGFQTAEFLLEHGLIDRIVPRHELRAELAKLLGYLAP
ncbi:MAG: acetyl-CoA carboxylase, carboxyltransferase subunit beta [Verrucomicrobiota bacterium]